MRRNASHLIHQRAAQIEEHMFHWPREDSPASKRSKHQASLNCVAPVLASALRLVPFGFPVVVLVPATGSSTDSDWQHRFSCLRSIFERQSCATCRHERFWRIATWQQIGLGHKDWLATQTGKLPDDEVRERAGYPRTATKHKMFNNSPALALEPTFVTNYAGFNYLKLTISTQWWRMNERISLLLLFGFLHVSMCKCVMFVSLTISTSQWGSMS